MGPCVFVLSVGDPLGELHCQRSVLGRDGHADVLAFEDRLDSGVGREGADTGVVVDGRVVCLDGLEEGSVRGTECQVSIRVCLAGIGFTGQGVLRNCTALVEFSQASHVLDGLLIVCKSKLGLISIHEVNPHAVQLSGHVPLRGAVDSVIALAVCTDLSGVVEHLFHGLGRGVFIQACALENFLVVGGDVGTEVPRKRSVVLVCTQLGRIPNGLNELVADTGSLYIKVHEEVGL